jgi:hypothetical protein
MADDKQKAEQEVSWLGARLREPSTYVGGAVLLGLLGLHDAPAWAHVLELAGMAIGGAIAILLPEGKQSA